MNNAPAPLAPPEPGHGKETTMATITIDRHKDDEMGRA
jgi:hypothetical protein